MYLNNKFNNNLNYLLITKGRMDGHDGYIMSSVCQEFKIIYLWHDRLIKR